MHYYITGDTHGDFSRIAEFCEANGTDTEDVMIILGDAGINYYLDARDRDLKNELGRLPITLFCVHGNHEARPWEADGDYEETEWKGGMRDITMLKVKKAISVSCLKIMMRYARKRSRLGYPLSSKY
ncbi:MAG: metallophosphoesterase [Lachnospiraceae bacterium]|nr:metallophosphoesterase [Lachnospiraceae bacterium]